jgi:putative oxidoreductase
MIAKIQTLYGLFQKVANSLQSPVLLLIRLDWGYEFFESGRAHLNTMPDFIKFFEGLGIPLPSLNAHFVAVLEAGGGILLILGLGSRILALLLAGDMFVALVTADSEAVKSLFSDPDKFFNATPHAFLFICLILLAFGPGKISLDHLIASRFRKQPQSAAA